MNIKNKHNDQNNAPLPSHDQIAQKILPFLQKKVDCKVGINPNGNFLFITHPIENKKEKPKQRKEESIQEKSHPQNKLEVQMLRAEFTQEKFELYKKYQMTIHNDKESDVSAKGFKRFLCESPLKFIPPTAEEEKSKFKGYGSFHQHYILNGKLIAVGVVDILPKCLSSVYFFYDPEYTFLSMGVYSALKEIEWIQKTSNTVPKLKYYYLGFYIHSCVKMRYKGQYKPSDLVCPETLEWVPLADAIPKLEASKYSRLKEGTGSDGNKPVQIQEVPILLRNSIVHINELNKKGQDILKPKLEEWFQKVGPECAKRIIVSVN